jgi:hypothetical protein
MNLAMHVPAIELARVGMTAMGLLLVELLVMLPDGLLEAMTVAVVASRRPATLAVPVPLIVPMGFAVGPMSIIALIGPVAIHTMARGLPVVMTVRAMGPGVRPPPVSGPMVIVGAALSCPSVVRTVIFGTEVRVAITVRPIGMARDLDPCRHTVVVGLATDTRRLERPRNDRRRGQTQHRSEKD